MSAETLVWITPTLGAMVTWGLAQGLVKRYIGEVPPARFCLFYAFANAAVSLAFWAYHDTPPVLAPENRRFASLGLLAYTLDGLGWILYYQSIVHGPISIVGTLSAAYPALTVVFARLFLDEMLQTTQYVGVAAVIVGCLGLAYTPPEARTRRTQRRWMAYAGAAVLIWGVAATLMRYAYRLPGAHEASMALFLAVGGLATLGVYGLAFGRRGARQEWARALGPMATMAVGSLLAAIAYKKGPASVVTPLSGAYPVVTLGFAWALLGERPSPVQWAGIVLVLAGMVLTTATG
ncbi:MAG TPA: DMT family transporter [Vicinamibacteria bacterium]|nr:DMT family transporter [Vicinamibacteria bacterium]